MMTLQRYSQSLEQTDQQVIKGNQELHRELELKADELDRLFAAQLLQARTGLAERKSVELNPNMNIVELGRLNGERGRLYDKYTEIREAKMRGRRESVRVANDEKFKVMGERLEHIRDVMKFSSPAYFDQQELEFGRELESACVEKMRSSSMHLIGNSSREKQIIQLQDDYDSTKTLKSKSLPHSKRVSSPILQSSASPSPRSSSKGSCIGRRRVAPENAEERSLPNTSNFEEAGMRQLQGRRLQFSHIPRSKSINGQKPAAKRDDTLRSRSTKKSSLGYTESKNSSASSQNSGDAKPFLRKGSGTGPGTRSGITKPIAEVEANNMYSKEESTEMIDKQEDTVSMVIRSTPTDFYIENARSKQESERSDIPSADDIVIIKSNSRVERELVSEVTPAPLTLHTTTRKLQESPVQSPVSSTSTVYTTTRQLQDSPVQSPVSWTSRMHFPFSPSPKRSDTGSSIESQTCWNSKSHRDLETSSPRGRKKWDDVKKEARSFFSLSSFRSAKCYGSSAGRAQHGA